MIITTYSQMQRVLVQQVLPELIEYISKKAEEIIKKNLMSANISVSTLQDYVIHDIRHSGNKYVATIYIDDESAQRENEGGEEYGNDRGPYGYGKTYRKFMSLDGSTSYGGKTIVWNMINWLENTGAFGPFGNNPIYPIGVFKNAQQEVNNNLVKWTQNFLRKYGLS